MTTKAEKSEPSDPKAADAKPAAPAEAAKSDPAKPGVPSDPSERATGQMTPLATPDKIETSPIARVDPADVAPAAPPVEPPLVSAESPRARTQTMTSGHQPMQAPPEMPTTPPPVHTAMGGTEDPTNLPGPRDIPAGHPNDPAAAPGAVPRGDSRSFRRGGLEFALVYRRETYVISRVGALGTRGQWRVVEYPTSAAASHAYAKECSRFVSEGYSDYRA